jgi:hypothetical protein
MNRPVFVVRFRPLPGIDAIRALRATLKSALRQHGLRCIDAREEDVDQKVAAVLERDSAAFDESPF